MSTMTSSAPTMWSIHAGETGGAQSLFLEHNYIALGWPAMGHLGTLPNDQEAFRAKHRATYPGATERAIIQESGQLRRFVYEVRLGDICIYRPKPEQNPRSLIFIGRVTGPYLYNPYIHDHYHNLRRVEWLRSCPVSQFCKEALAEQSAAMTLSKIDTHAQEYLDALDGAF
jgi:restriction system protein